MNILLTDHCLRSPPSQRRCQWCSSSGWAINDPPSCWPSHHADYQRTNLSVRQLSTCKWSRVKCEGSWHDASAIWRKTSAAVVIAPIFYGSMGSIVHATPKVTKMEQSFTVYGMVHRVRNDEWRHALRKNTELHVTYCIVSVKLLFYQIISYRATYIIRQNETLQ